MNRYLLPADRVSDTRTFVDRLIQVVVRIKGGSRSREILEEGIKSGTEYSCPLKTQRLSSPVAVAAETTGALVVPTPTRAFFLSVYLVSVFNHHEGAASLKTRQGRECRARFVGHHSRFE